MKKITPKNRTNSKNNDEIQLLTKSTMLCMISAGSHHAINTIGLTSDLITQAVESTNDSSAATPGNGAGLRPPFN